MSSTFTAGGPAPNPGANPAANPYVSPQGGLPNAGVHTSPVLAFLLGFIPGVGAIYNGQYMKGLVHAVIFGLLVSLIDSVEHTAGAPLIGIIIAAFMFYMPFEAYHTARKRQLGITVDEWSSLVARNRYATRVPIGPILLIVLGVFFLLDTLHIIEFRELARFWPVLLIVAGAFMLYNRVSGAVQRGPVSNLETSTGGDYMESHHEQ